MNAIGDKRNFSSQPLATIRMARIDKPRPLNKERKRKKGCQGLRKGGNPEIPDTELNHRNITLVLCA